MYAATHTRLIVLRIAETVCAFRTVLPVWNSNDSIMA